MTNYKAKTLKKGKSDLDKLAAIGPIRDLIINGKLQPLGTFNYLGKDSRIEYPTGKGGEVTFYSASITIKEQMKADGVALEDIIMITGLIEEYSSREGRMRIQTENNHADLTSMKQILDTFGIKNEAKRKRYSDIMKKYNLVRAITISNGPNEDGTRAKVKNLMIVNPLFLNKTSYYSHYRLQAFGIEILDFLGREKMVALLNDVTTAHKYDYLPSELNYILEYMKVAYKPDFKMIENISEEQIINDTMEKIEKIAEYEADKETSAEVEYIDEETGEILISKSTEEKMVISTIEPIEKPKRPTCTSDVRMYAIESQNVNMSVLQASSRIIATDSVNDFEGLEL